MATSVDLAITDRFTTDQFSAARLTEATHLICSLKTEGDGGPRSLSNPLDLMTACERMLARRSNWIDASKFREVLAHDFTTKATSEPATTFGVSWAAPLAVLAPVLDEFVAASRAASVIGKIPGLRRVPFNVSVPSQTGTGSYTWVPQTGPKPASQLQLTSAVVRVAKISGIIAISEELAKLSDGVAEAVVRNELIEGSAQYLDSQFIDPTVTAVADTSPASITSAAPSIGSTTPAADVLAMVRSFTAANPGARGVWVMSPAVSMHIASAFNVTEIPTLSNAPVVLGEVGNVLTLLDPQAVLVAEGIVDVSTSTQSMVEFSTTPTSPITAGSAYVSLWQAGLIGYRVDRWASWTVARPSAVLYTVTNY